MASLAIDGVRWGDDRVTHVRWGSIDAATRTWTSSPTIVELGQVVNAIMLGTEVRTVFTLGGRTFLGPKVTTIRYAGGHVGIQTMVEDGRIEKSLEDLPPV